MAKKQAEPVVAASSKKEKKKSTAVAVRKSTQVEVAGDWKKELAKYAERAQATAVQSLSNWFSVRNGKLAFKGADLEDSEVDGIILDVNLENSFFDGPFDADNPQSPDCFALGYDIDEMKPHPNSPSPQNENCATCEQNKWGSDPRPNSKGKACKNIRRIALISGADITQHGIEAAEIGRLRVPVTSVANLSAHINALKSKGLATFQTVTHITVEPDPKTQVKVSFNFPDAKNIKTFPDKVMPVVIARVHEGEEQLNEPYPEREATEAFESTKQRKSNVAAKGKGRKQTAAEPARRAKF